MAELFGFSIQRKNRDSSGEKTFSTPTPDDGTVDIAGGGFFGSTLIHDINVSYQLEEGLAVFGGINNLTDEEPFATQTAWPVGPRGRTLFLGVNYTM